MKRPTNPTNGFSVAELLVAALISSLIAVTMLSLYQAGLFEFRHASGRIELTRTAREALLRIGPLLSTAVKPNSVAEAIYAPPPPPPPYDTDPFNAPDVHTAVMFSSPLDLMVSSPALPDPRNVIHSLYEIALVPGSGAGNDIVLRRMVDPVTIDVTVEPRLLVRNIDNFDVKRIDNTALLLRIDVSGDKITDTVVRQETEDRTPLFLSLNTVVQIPYYTK